jgi:hypothetical protein
VTSADQVVVAWNAPYNGGTAILFYTITFRQSDGITYSESLTTCDGSDALIMAQKICYIPFTTFKVDPFNLAWGSSIYAKVSATNIMGSSLTSSAGNGATITKIPDPPENLSSDDGISNAIVIGLNWDTPTETGGLEILDYRLWYDQGTNDWFALDYGIQVTSYITEVPLVAGTWY